MLHRCAAVTVRDGIMAHRLNNHDRNTPLLLRPDLPDWVAQSDVSALRLKAAASELPPYRPATPVQLIDFSDYYPFVWPLDGIRVSRPAHRHADPGGHSTLSPEHHSVATCKLRQHSWDGALSVA